MQQLVLASSSVFRKALLQRLGLPFDAASPDLDETPLAGEKPEQCATRLAAAKATFLAPRFPEALLIGSDQVAVCGGIAVGKPGNHQKASEQLRMMRGKDVSFHTALCLLNAKTGARQSALVTTVVTFRHYSDDEIERYLRAEQPYDCAGSAKAEGLGIVLIARIRGDDPNALIGLPLIELVSMLRHEGVAIP